MKNILKAGFCMLFLFSLSGMANAQQVCCNALDENDNSYCIPIASSDCTTCNDALFDATFGSKNYTGFQCSDISLYATPPCQNLKPGGGTPPTTTPPSGPGWTDKVGVRVTDNDIIKTADSGWGTGGAASNFALAAGANGSVQFTVNKARMRAALGLSTVNTDATYQTIHYALYLARNNVLRAMENGQPQGAFNNYVPGDVLKIERNGTTISYLKNGQVFYTSTVPSTDRLIVDIAIDLKNNKLENIVASFDPDATTTQTPSSVPNSGPSGPTGTAPPSGPSGAQGPSGPSTSNNNSGGAVPSTAWKDKVGVTIAGNTITKTNATGWGRAGAASTFSLPAGKEGWVEAVAPSNRKKISFGLSQTNIDEHYKKVDYSFYLASNRVYRIIENGKVKGSPKPYAAGDTFKIERKGTTIGYLINGKLVYKSKAKSTSSLLIDIGIGDKGGKLSGIKQNFGTI